MQYSVIELNSDNEAYFKYMGALITDNGRNIIDISSRMAQAKTNSTE